MIRKLFAGAVIIGAIALALYVEGTAPSSAQIVGCNFLAQDTHGTTVNTLVACATPFPTYAVNGSPPPATSQCVQGTVTAAGASTTVTLTGAAVFTTAPAEVSIIDLTDGTEVASSVKSSITASAFTFTSVNAKVYYYRACGF